MFEELFRGLATKGHQVDVYGHYPMKNPIPNYTYFGLEGLIRTVTTKNMTFDEAFNTDGVETARFRLKLTQDSICGLLGYPIFQKLIHNSPFDPPSYDMVITEATFGSTLLWHGCVYFSFGSFTRIETFPKHIFKAFYEAFENVKPVRVLLQIAHPEELPSGLPTNVLTQTWFQQVPILKHKNTKIFITQGGLMGGQESIYFGVPMVGVPLLGDQRFNVGNYVPRKVAVQITLPEITESTLTSAINEVLNNPIYRESMQKLSKKFRDHHPLTPMDTAIYWIEYIHRHGKDALRSPSENLLWWQKSLLDIYLFLGGTALTIVFIIIKVIKICINFVLRKKDDKLKKQ